MNYVLVRELIINAIKEDMYYGDITTESIVDDASRCRVQLISKEEGTLAGKEVFDMVFKEFGGVTIKWSKEDGETFKKGEVIALIEGKTRSVLSGERIALNFLQRMSGIATYTRALVKETKGLEAKVVCTRKTTPTMRILEKYAVKMGGGHNHRFSLSDGAMIKDNHILAAGGIKEAVNKVHKNYPHMKCIEVEVESIEELKVALDTEADVIMLDNMSTEDMREAVIINRGRKVLEASGNMDLARIKEVGETGVDFISVGSLTHSPKSVDLSMKKLSLIR